MKVEGWPRGDESTTIGPVHEVTVLPANVTFECSENETILTAALRRGFNLPYGCRKGNCGTCKAQVLAGEVDLEIDSAYTLSAFEQQQGVTLLCSAYAVDDTTIEMEGLELSDLEAHLTPAAEYVAEVSSVEALTHDIRSLTLTLDGRLPFRAGQFVQLSLPGTDVWRSYSMANPSAQPDRLEFMIKLVPGGLFSERLESLRAGEQVRVHGPHGSFWVREDARPLLIVGGGAGMAPLWSILQDLAERRDPRRVRFFYGARAPEDLFHLDELAAVAQRLVDFEFVTALSHVRPSEAEGHHCGMVSDVVEQLVGSDLIYHDAYLCGPPPMIDASLLVLERHGLEVRKNIFYDKFTAS